MRGLSLGLLFGLARGQIADDPIPTGKAPRCALGGFVRPDGLVDVGADVTGMTRTSNLYTVRSRLNSSNEYVFNVCGALGHGYQGRDTTVTPMLVRKPVATVDIARLFHGSTVYGYWNAPKVSPTTVTDGLDGWFRWQTHGASTDLNDVRTKYVLYGAAPYNATIKLNCATDEKVDIDADTETNSSVVITVYSPRACGVVPHGEGVTHGRTLLQTEIYILIGCFSVVIAYVLLGYIWNKFRGEGDSKIPHSDCLFGCPGLVRDGCVYTRELVFYKSSNGWGADGAYNLLDQPGTAGSRPAMPTKEEA